MKLRSIALAGLLVTGIVVMSGCSEDDVKELLGINTSAVYAVNDLGSAVDVTVGGDTQQVESQGLAKVFPTTSTDSKVVVSYSSGTGSVSLNNDGIHVYAATSCTGSTDGRLVDTYNGQKIRVMNLTDAPIVKTDIELVHNEVVVPLPDDAAACAVTLANVTDTTGDWNVTVNGGETYSVTLPANIGFEVVVYSTTPNSGTVVPLVGFDDLL